MNHITDQEKQKIYNHEYYLKNKERILKKNRAWSKAQRKSETEEERYELMVKTNRKKYGKNYYNKIGKLSGEKMKGEQLAQYRKEKKERETGFGGALSKILRKHNVTITE